jgi:hypothetical protein
MDYKVVYFLKYDIFIALMVNIDQTTLHLVLTTREQTWVNKDTNHINVSNIEDTRLNDTFHFIICRLILLSSFKSFYRHHKKLPPNIKRKTMCINDGYNLTFNDNPWSTLETTKRFVHKILLSYLHSQIEQLSLSKHQKCFGYWIDVHYIIMRSL